MNDGQFFFVIAAFLLLLWWLQVQRRRRNERTVQPAVVNDAPVQAPAPEPPRTLNQMADRVIARMKERTTP